MTENCYIMALRDALREELDATNTYDKLLEIAKEEDKAVIEEIKRDEINHQGRLLALIMKHDPSEMRPYNEGLEQKG